MNRSVALWAGFVVAASPGGATAQYPWCQPIPLCPPMPCYSVPVIYVPVYCWPAYPVPLPPPQVHRTPVVVVPPVASPEIKRAAAEEPNAVPETRPLTPAPPPSAALDTLPPRTPVPLATPGQAPAPSEAVTPAASTEPKSAAKRGAEVAIPPIDLPTSPTPKLAPAAEANTAPRTPAPSPDTLLPLMPPAADPKKGKDTGTEPLLPLVLPPDSSRSTSQSSPLTGVARAALMVKVIPVGVGTGGAAAAMRKVGFFNYTARDLEMVVDGKRLTLPAKHYVQAEVPPRFAYRVGATETESLTVPDGSAGLEVVFRD